MMEGALPPSICRLATSRLLDYAEDDCRPQHRALVRPLAAEFETGTASAIPRLIRDFMLFTNDMDTSHGQSIHQCDPELVALLEQAGFPWIDDTLHAPIDRAAQGTPRPRYPSMQVQNEALKLHRDLSVTIRSLRDALMQRGDEFKQMGGDPRQTQDEPNKTHESLKQTHDG
jgi:hypothetical protein